MAKYNSEKFSGEAVLIARRIQEEEQGLASMFTMNHIDNAADMMARAHLMIRKEATISTLKWAFRLVSGVEPLDANIRVAAHDEV